MAFFFFKLAIPSIGKDMEWWEFSYPADGSVIGTTILETCFIPLLNLNTGIPYDLGFPFIDVHPIEKISPKMFLAALFIKGKPGNNPKSISSKMDK